MAAKIVFLCFLTAASARHLFDGFEYNPSIPNDRNNGHNERLYDSNVASRSIARNDFTQNNVHNDNRLRTNLNSARNSERTTEYVIDNVYTNVAYTHDGYRESVAQNYPNVEYTVENTYQDRNHQHGVTPKTNKISNNDDDTKIKTNLPVTERNRVTHQGPTDNGQETTKRIEFPNNESKNHDSSKSGKGEADSKKEEEIGWVWGSEGEEKKKDTKDSLGDRAAFAADGCPSGRVKVRGMCVQQH